MATLNPFFGPGEEEPVVPAPIAPPITPPAPSVQQTEPAPAVPVPTVAPSAATPGAVGTPPLAITPTEAPAPPDKIELITHAGTKLIFDSTTPEEEMLQEFEYYSVADDLRNKANIPDSISEKLIDIFRTQGAPMDLDLLYNEGKIRLPDRGTTRQPRSLEEVNVAGLTPENVPEERAIPGEVLNLAELSLDEINNELNNRQRVLSVSQVAKNVALAGVDFWANAADVGARALDYTAAFALGSEQEKLEAVADFAEWIGVDEGIGKQLVAKHGPVGAMDYVRLTTGELTDATGAWLEEEYAKSTTAEKFLGELGGIVSAGPVFGLGGQLGAWAFGAAMKPITSVAVRYGGERFGQFLLKYMQGSGIMATGFRKIAGGAGGFTAYDIGRGQEPTPENLMHSVILGAVVGAAGHFPSSLLKTAVPKLAGVQGIVKMGGEVTALVVTPAMLEGRDVTKEDFIHAFAMLAGLKAIHKGGRLGAEQVKILTNRVMSDMRSMGMVSKERAAAMLEAQSQFRPEDWKAIRDVINIGTKNSKLSQTEVGEQLFTGLERAKARVPLTIDQKLLLQTWAIRAGLERYDQLPGYLNNTPLLPAPAKRGPEDPRKTQVAIEGATIIPEMFNKIKTDLARGKTDYNESELRGVLNDVSKQQGRGKPTKIETAFLDEVMGRLAKDTTTVTHNGRFPINALAKSLTEAQTKLKVDRVDEGAFYGWRASGEAYAGQNFFSLNRAKEIVKDRTSHGTYLYKAPLNHGVLDGVSGHRWHRDHPDYMMHSRRWSEWDRPIRFLGELQSDVGRMMGEVGKQIAPGFSKELAKPVTEAVRESLRSYNKEWSLNEKAKEAVAQDRASMERVQSRLTREAQDATRRGDKAAEKRIADALAYVLGAEPRLRQRELEAANKDSELAADSRWTTLLGMFNGLGLTKGRPQNIYERLIPEELRTAAEDYSRRGVKVGRKNPVAAKAIREKLKTETDPRKREDLELDLARATIDGFLGWAYVPHHNSLPFLQGASWSLGRAFKHKINSRAVEKAIRSKEEELRSLDRKPTREEIKPLEQLQQALKAGFFTRREAMTFRAFKEGGKPLYAPNRNNTTIITDAYMLKGDFLKGEIQLMNQELRPIYEAAKEQGVWLQKKYGLKEPKFVDGKLLWWQVPVTTKELQAVTPGIGRKPLELSDDFTLPRSFTEGQAAIRDTIRRGLDKALPPGRKIPTKDGEFLDTGEFNKGVLTDIDYVNRAMLNTTTLLQVNKLRGEKTPGLQGYVRLHQDEASPFQARWKNRAAVTGEKIIKLGDTQRRILGEMNNAETVHGTKVLKRPWTREEAEAWLFKNNYLDKVSKDFWVVRDTIKEDFRRYITDVENAYVNAVKGKLGVIDPKVELDIRQQYETMRNLPYVPLHRDGKWKVIVRNEALDGPDKVVELQMTHSKRAAKRLVNELRQEHGKGSIKVTFAKSTRTERSYSGLPRAVIEHLRAINKKVGMEERSTELEKLLFSMVPGSGFAGHMQRRKFTPGFENDIYKAYMTYMQHGINHLTRIKYGWQMRDAIDLVSEQARQAEQQVLPKGVRPTDKNTAALNLRKLERHMENHFKWFMDPKGEWALARAWTFNLAFAFEASSMGVQLTQLPLLTYPYLAARYGDRVTVQEMTGAMKDVTQYMRTGKGLKNRLEEDLLRDLDRAGITNESFGVDVATGGSQNLTSFSHRRAGSKAFRTVQGMNNFVTRYGPVMFRSAEHYNRYTTALAAFRLSQKYGQGIRGEDGSLRPEPSPQYLASYKRAAEATTTTQFEYLDWNKPLLFRGKKSIFFIFQQFTQHSIMFTLMDKGAARYIGLMAVLGGLAALPFAEDLMDILKGASKAKARIAGGDVWDPEVWYRNWAAEMELDPNLIDSGLGGSALPIELWGGQTLGAPSNLASRTGLGDILPGTEAFDKLMGGEAALDTIAGSVARDVAGPIGQAPMNALQWAFGSSEFSDLKGYEKLVPFRALRNPIRGYRYLTEGREVDKGGATITDFEDESVSAAIKQALGFAPAATAEEYKKQNLIRQADLFAAAKFSSYSKELGNLYLSLYFERPEGADKVELMQNIREVEREVSDWNKQVVKDGKPWLAINRTKLKAAAKSRRRGIIRRSLKQGKTKREELIRRHYERLFEVPSESE